MNKFKKKLLKILILTAISAYSINCFAMKKNSEDIFKNSKNKISQTSYYDEDSYNSIKTPVNKINIKEINEEESLFGENNKYLNNKKNSKNIFNNNQSQYSDFDELSIASINPTNNLNNINNDINKINNENNKFLNKKRKLENEDEKKEENISKISNDNKDNHNSEKASSNEINNNIIEINEDNKLNVSAEINDDKKLFMKEYKKFFITYIFKEHIASEVDNVIEEYVENYNSKNTKNNNFIYLESKRCRIGLNLNLGYKDLKPIKIQIWLPRVIKQKFKEEDFENFIDNIMSNYKVIIERARKKTIDSFKNLDMDKTIEIIDNDKFIAGASTIPSWEDFYVFVPQDSKSKLIENVLNDLKNINENKKDPCAKFFSNFEAFVHSINIKAVDNETQENFKVVKGTNIKGENLVKPTIKRNGKEIKFKNYTF